MTSAQGGCRCLRHPPFGQMDQWQYHLLKTLFEVPALLDGLVQQMRQASFPERDRFAVRLALEEAILNAIQHGHRGDPRKTVLLRFCLDETFVMAQVEDEGPGFSPDVVPDPRAADEPDAGGRGLLLMKHFMNSVEYNAAGNCVTLCKHRSSASRT